MLGDAGALVAPIQTRVHQGLSAHAVNAMLAWQRAGETGPLAVLARETHPISDASPAFDGFTQAEQAASDALYSKQIGQISGMANVTVLRGEPEA